MVVSCGVVWCGVAGVVCMALAYVGIGKCVCMLCELCAVQTRARAATTGEDGSRALHLCERILTSMETE